MKVEWKNAQNSIRKGTKLNLFVLGCVFTYMYNNFLFGVLLSQRRTQQVKQGCCSYLERGFYGVM